MITPRIMIYHKIYHFRVKVAKCPKVFTEAWKMENCFLPCSMMHEMCSLKRDKHNNFLSYSMVWEMFADVCTCLKKFLSCDLTNPKPCLEGGEVILVTQVAVNVKVKVMNWLLLPMCKSVAISVVLSLRVITLFPSGCFSLVLFWQPS